ncbi:hypothetical protein DL768_003638 [Monosporascus sp. mg162]|nr:hypothetical protein DL768_003638 [Monosporascus sp. mg162]
MDDEDGIPHHYDDGNRAFLQAFMARGTMTFKEARPILAAIFSVQENQRTEPGQVTEEDFESYVSAASAAISPFDMEIRSTMHQVRKERVYAVVNTTSDPMAQMATLHSAEEIAFVKRVIDAMFEKYNSRRMEVMCLDGMQANKFRAAPRNVEENDMEDGESQPQPTQLLKGLKSSEAEAMMVSMVEEGWFERSREGLYSLSPKALMELRSWLVESYNDPDAEEGEWQRVKFCEACKEIVTAGQRCSEIDCNARLHDICEDAFWRTRREKKCPKCQREWTGRHFVGERAVTETEAYKRGRRRSGRGGRSSNLIEEVLEENADDGDEDAMEE